ncbi:hypothetical protein BC826DRAFT_1172849 [Russula brevipes]|nr:hypothetical protein BC826DRAFT_1172849 [Russula brevipes]
MRNGRNCPALATCSAVLTSAAGLCGLRVHDSGRGGPPAPVYGDLQSPAVGVRFGVAEGWGGGNKLGGDAVCVGGGVVVVRGRRHHAGECGTSTTDLRLAVGVGVGGCELRRSPLLPSSENFKPVVPTRRPVPWSTDGAASESTLRGASPWIVPPHPSHADA